VDARVFGLVVVKFDNLLTDLSVGWIYHVGRVHLVRFCSGSATISNFFAGSIRLPQLLLF